MKYRSGKSSLLALIALVAVAPQKPAPKDPPKTVQIVIDKATFTDVKVALKIGDTIEWVNEDAYDHTATAKNKNWDVVIPAGKTAKLVLKKAGTVDYYCRFHPNMTATLVIAPAK